MGPGKIIRVVIDTNVVVSALLFGGIPGKLVLMWQSSLITPYISKEILDEYIRILSYPRFKLDETEIEYLVYREILPCFEIVDLPSFRADIIKKDPSDDLFIYCAQKAGARHIISGDHHLLSLKTYEQIRIITAAQFLRCIKVGREELS